MTRKEKAARRRPPSLSVPPRTRTGAAPSVVRRTVSALNCPTRRAAVPGATTIIVIAVTVGITTDANMYAGRVEENALRLNSGGGPNRRCAEFQMLPWFAVLALENVSHIGKRIIKILAFGCFVQEFTRKNVAKSKSVGHVVILFGFHN